MNNYRLISDYMKEDIYRKSFNELAINTFGLDFEPWYQDDLFYDRYICYSYVHENKIVANVSINKFNLMVEGKEKKAIQLGTVMTHLDYRNQGLASALIKHIIQIYEKEYDIIYLFANKKVLDFYPRLGFKKVIESAYTLEAKELQIKTSNVRRLNIDNEEDYMILMRLANNRQPISKTLGVFKDKWPLMVYCLYEYREDLYYLSAEDSIVIMKREEGTLHLYDILSLKPINLDSIIEKIIELQDEILEFHFVPELSKYAPRSNLKERENDTLFVLTSNFYFKEGLFPMTSHT